MARKKRGEEKPFSLAPVVSLLHERLSEAVCQEVFEGVRDKERQRDWTLDALARFWLAVVIEAPPALSHLLGRTRTERAGLLPHVMATDSAFYQRCKNLSNAFFAGLYAHFVASVLEEAPATYAPEIQYLRRRFTSIEIIDGSRLDPIAHRLKLLRNEEAAILPGCITALYDLFRGFATQIYFDPDAASSEHTRAQRVLELIAAGTLVIGDRLYCSLEMFDLLDDVGAFGLFRLNKTVKVVEVERVSRTKKDGAVIEDWIVEAGTGAKARFLRRITLQRDGTTHAALTSVLDPERLSAEEVTLLYPRRWKVERLFFDLKEVLNLHRFYAANPNAVAMQVFAAAMVHVAFRVAQARIAESHRISPEDLSPKKLYPRLACASKTVTEAELYFDRVEETNRKKLKKPDWTDVPKTMVFLKDLLVRKRVGPRRRREYSKERTRWKSVRHVRGGRRLLN